MSSWERVAPFRGPATDPSQWVIAEDSRTVADLIQRPPTVVEPHSKARSVDALAANLGFEHLPVVDPAGNLAGILCRCDVREVGPETEVKACMSFPPVTIDAASPLKQAAAVMRLLDIGALPVLRGDRLLGLVTWGDLRRAQVVTEADQPRCVVCRARHHVRIHARSGLAVCLDCQDRAGLCGAEAFDDGLIGSE